MTHTSTERPEALRLADKYEIEGFLQDHRFAQEQWCRQAAAELRRQHARIAELEAQVQPRPSNRRTTMIDKKALQDALTNAFIGYQHRLDCPMPIPHETEEMIILKYRTDPSFHAKVKSLVSGVMRIVGEHLDGGHPMADKITAEQQPAPPETAPLELRALLAEAKAKKKGNKQ